MGRKEHAREQEEFHALASEVVDLYLHEEEWLDIYNVLQRLLEQDAEVAISTLAAFGASAVELLAERAGLTTQQALDLSANAGTAGCTGSTSPRRASVRTRRPSARTCGEGPGRGASPTTSSRCRSSCRPNWASRR